MTCPIRNKRFVFSVFQFLILFFPHIKTIVFFAKKIFVKLKTQHGFFFVKLKLLLIIALDQLGNFPVTVNSQRPFNLGSIFVNNRNMEFVCSSAISQIGYTETLHHNFSCLFKIQIVSRIVVLLQLVTVI